MGAIRQQDSGSASSNNPTLPSDPVVGNTLVLIIAARQETPNGVYHTNDTLDSSWTLDEAVDGYGGSSNSIHLYTKVATDTEKSWKTLPGSGASIRLYLFEVEDVDWASRVTKSYEATAWGIHDPGDFDPTTAEDVLIAGIGQQDHGGGQTAPNYTDAWVNDYLEDKDGNPGFGGNFPSYSIDHIQGTGSPVSTEWDSPSNGYDPADFGYVAILLSGDPGDLTCAFSADPVSGFNPLSVDFTDETTGTPDGWLWDFGDGGTSTAQNPTHVYADPGVYDVTLTATRSGPFADECTLTISSMITVSDAVGWDIYAADDLNGPILATISTATRRNFRVEEDGPGYGEIVINRHDPLATAANFAKGNLIKVRIPEISTDYIHAFFLEQGDFDILSSDEEGGEELTFGGRGALAYLDRARMWYESFTTDPTLTDVWELVWKTGKIVDPVGAAVVGGDATYVYVISATKRRIYKIRQSDRIIVRTSPALWTGADNYAGGLSADPSDSTILWALEAPWSQGGAGNTKIRKIRISDWAVLDTFNLGSAVKLTEVKASSSDFWCSRYEATNTIQKRSKTDGSLTTNYNVSYGGVTQEYATGVSLNGTKLAYWYKDKKRALIASTSAPTTITDKITTTGISAFGGDWTTEAGEDYFYPVSYTADLVWKYQLTAASPTDPINGDWRLDELTPGAILWRIVAEAQAGARPVQPIPEMTYVFDSSDDSTSDAWNAHTGTEEFTARVGDLVLDTVLRLIPYGLTVQMSPYLVLGGYNQENWGTDRTAVSFGAGKVRFVGGVNIAEAMKRRLDDRRVDTIMMATGENGTVATATDDDLGYQREGFLATSLTNLTALEGSAEAELQRERDVSEALAFPVTWGDDEAAGLYLPGPAGTNGHYWVGDTVRVKTGTGEFDINEQDFAIKAISISENEAGEWDAVPELQSAYLPTEVITEGGSGSSDIGGTSGSGSTTVKTTPIIVKDTLSGDAYSGTQIESDDWGVFQPGSGRVGISIRRSGGLDEVQEDGTTIVAQPSVINAGHGLDVADEDNGIAGLAVDESELEIVDLSTAETDTALVLHPDGTGGVEWTADGSGPEAAFDHGNMGAAETVDLADGAWHRGTLDADCTITVSGFTVDEGLVCVFEVTQDGTGGWAITWDADVTFAGDDQPDTAASSVSFFLLWTSAGDSTIYGARIGSSTTVAALDDLTDVTITSPATADRLRYDGSGWVNSALIWTPMTVYDGTTWLPYVDGDGNQIMTEA